MSHRRCARQQAAQQLGRLGRIFGDRTTSTDDLAYGVLPWLLTCFVLLARGVPGGPALPVAAWEVPESVNTGHLFASIVRVRALSDDDLTVHESSRLRMRHAALHGTCRQALQVTGRHSATDKRTNDDDDLNISSQDTKRYLPWER